MKTGIQNGIIDSFLMKRLFDDCGIFKEDFLNEENEFDFK